MVRLAVHQYKNGTYGVQWTIPRADGLQKIRILTPMGDWHYTKYQMLKQCSRTGYNI